MCDIQLKPEDVPGAQLVFEDISQHNCTQLKRWLKCRGLRVNGNKVDLIQRVKECINSGNGDKIDVAIDKGKWYDQKKLAFNNNSLDTCKPQNLKVESCEGKWKIIEKNQIPVLFNHGHIYHYIVESLQDSAGQDANETNDSNTTKPLRRAKQYIESNFVTNVESCVTNSRFLVRAKVQSSMKTEVYKVVLSLSSHSGAVLSAVCHCKQSSLGKCSHVAATLLYVENVANEESDITCTSKRCTWNQGSKIKNPQKVQDAVYRGNIGEKALYDPRSKRAKLENLEEFESKKNAFLHEITFEKKDEKEVSMWQRLLSYTYQDFSLCQEEITVLIAQTKNFLNNLHEEARSFPSDPHLVVGTEDQSKSDLWHQKRSLVFTASKCKTIVSLSTASAKKNFLKNHFWRLESISTQAMVYGMENEDKAVDSYRQYMEQTFNEVIVTKTGLWLSKEYPFLGGSPDGIVSYLGTDGVEVVGLLEVKAPFILAGKDPKDFHTFLTKPQLSNFCLSLSSDGSPFLKPTHPYYYQVQMNLAIHQLPWCDFVVWSTAGFIAIRIFRNENFWAPVLNKLVSQYLSLVIPEYFLQKTVRDLPPFEMDVTPFANNIPKQD